MIDELIRKKDDFLSEKGYEPNILKINPEHLEELKNDKDTINHYKVHAEYDELSEEATQRVFILGVLINLSDVEDPTFE
ncbi:hypothetical protein [Jeotgalibacillus soli]|uniref:Uncharacterized protein n=1 Tax=Jeotgalibacillus soli TaxID=889306 RepID=A0A0C2R1C4_9BACL|nr:hypothetical protein [Jeotgalibacillus soli]KIL44100.1 hypothetical protein KP78_30640 [Jeotgalibacillus soli]